MVTCIIFGVVCIFAGGYGGYRWGAAVERKAANVAGVLGGVAKKL